MISPISVRNSKRKITPTAAEIVYLVNEEQAHNVSMLEDDRFSIHLTDKNETPSKLHEFNYNLSFRQNTRVFKEFFKNYIENVNSTIIEKYEADLYTIIEDFHDNCKGPLRIENIFFSYLFVQNDFSNKLTGNKVFYKEELNETISSQPEVLIQLRIIQRIIDLFSALMIKWKLFKKSNYEYKFNHRVKLISILDLGKFSDKCLSLETFWFCVAINLDLMSEIATKPLKQYSELLRTQINFVFEKFLEVKYECFPNIHDVIGTKSKEYRKKFLNTTPNLSSVKGNYLELKMPNFLQKIVKKKQYEKVSELIGIIHNLEQVYRAFEKQLIGRFLLLDPNI